GLDGFQELIENVITRVWIEFSSCHPRDMIRSRVRPDLTGFQVNRPRGGVQQQRIRIEPRPCHGSWAPLAGDLQYSRDSAGRFDPAHVFVQIIASFLTECPQLPQRAVEQPHNSVRFLPVVTGHPTSLIVMPADTVRVNESPLVFARESQRESQLTAMDFRFVITRSRVVDVSRW